MVRTGVVVGLLLLLGMVPGVEAQELNCRVSVNYQALSGTDVSHLDELGRAIEAYLNEHRWTEDTFEEAERITCNLTITFTELQGTDRFRAQLSLVTRRPIWGTTQETSVLQLNDGDWQFTYVRNQPLVRDLGRFDPLTSVLDFYAYLILGYDYDTFSELGGSPFFQKAREIAELAQASGQPGWLMGSNDKSRTALVVQLQDPRMQRFRKALYLYHFEGLDHFTSQPEQARQRILEALRMVQDLLQEMARPYVVDLFFAVKYQEIVSIFEDAPNRREVYGLLMDLDPSHLNAYNRLNL